MIFAKAFVFPNIPLLTSQFSESQLCSWPVSSIQIPRCIGLGVNAYVDFLTSAILTPKSNIADEALPTDSLTLKQQDEWVICDPPALTRQAQEGITLVDCLPDTARFPIAIEVHHGDDHCTGRPKPIPPFPRYQRPVVADFSHHGSDSGPLRENRHGRRWNPCRLTAPPRRNLRPRARGRGLFSQMGGLGGVLINNARRSAFGGTPENTCSF